LPYGEMTRENIRSPAPVREKSSMRLGLVLPETLLVMGFGGTMVHVCGPLGTVDPGQVVLTPKPGHVQYSEGKVMIG
jgi:hypothetical protein